VTLAADESSGLRWHGKILRRTFVQATGKIIEEPPDH